MAKKTIYNKLIFRAIWKRKLSCNDAIDELQLSKCRVATKQLLCCN